MSGLEYVAVLVVMAAVAYAAGYARGARVGELRAVRNQVVQVDDVLSRWRKEQRP